MRNKFFKILLLILLNLNLNLQAEQIFISVYINDEVITNYDLEIEKNFLTILNPDLKNLNKTKLLEIAKKSLINETIKKKEIEKIIDLKSAEINADQYLKKIYAQLGFANDLQFTQILEQNQTYKIDEVKKKLEIELLWSQLIYSKFKNLIKINKEKIIEEIENNKNNKINEYLLSEIIFKKTKDETLEELITKIKSSIQEIGFNNTANIFSISESSKFGGRLGWVKENDISNTILNKIKEIKVGGYSEVLKIENNYMIFKIDNIKTISENVDKKNELEKKIQIETEKQLNKFSKTFFDKSRLNYYIDEK